MANRRLPASWFRWSDGRAMNAVECAGMKRVMGKRSLRVPGETTRARWLRTVAALEAGKAARK